MSAHPYEQVLRDAGFQRSQDDDSMWHLRFPDGEILDCIPDIETMLYACTLDGVCITVESAPPELFAAILRMVIDHHLAVGP